MINSLPKSLIESAKQILQKSKIPSAYISFRDVDEVSSRIDEELKNLEEWKKEKENKRNAINSLNLESEHTDDDKTHVYRYTAASKPLNRLLYRIHNEGGTVPHTMEITGRYNFTHDIRGLDAAINRNKLKHDLVVYSGVGWNPASRMQADGLIHLPAYTSTSTSKNIAYNFAKSNKKHDTDIHILRIHNPKDSTGLYTHDDPTITQYEGENEFIIPRNTKIKINNVPEIYKDEQYGHNVHVWNAQRLESEPVDTEYTPSYEGRQEIFNKNGVKIYKTDTLGALKKHYPDFYNQDQGERFHHQHVAYPIYHLHEPNGRVWQSDTYDHEFDNEFIFMPANRTVTASVDDVVKKYPQVADVRHLFVRKDVDDEKGD